MGDRALCPEWVSQRAMEHVVLCAETPGLGADRSRVSLAVDPAPDNRVLAICQTCEPLSGAVSVMGVVRRVPQSDGSPSQCAVRLRAVAWNRWPCDLAAWLTCLRADASSISFLSWSCSKPRPCYCIGPAPGGASPRSICYLIYALAHFSCSRCARPSPV